MSRDNPCVVYWDASAVLSALLEDIHSPVARSWVRKEGYHLLSTLAYVETCAVIGRIQRQGDVAEELIAAALETFAHGYWRRMNPYPDWNGDYRGWRDWIIIEDVDVTVEVRLESL